MTDYTLSGSVLLMIRSIESTQPVYDRIFADHCSDLNPNYTCSCPTEPNPLLSRVLEATDEDLAAYKQKLFDLLRSSDNLDDKCKSSTHDLLNNMRAHIIAKAAEITKRSESNHEPSWGAYWTKILIHEFNQVVAKFEEQFHEHLDNFRIKAFDVGVDLADNGFDYATDKAGMNIGLPQLILGSLKMDTESLKIQSGFTADLVSRMTTMQVEELSKEIRLSMALGESPTKLQARLANKIDAGPWRSTKVRAEAIARTEISRVEELGRHQRAMQTQRYLDEGDSGIRLRREFLCAPILGWPCKICRPYEGLVYDAVTGDPYKHEPSIHPEKRKELKGEELNGSARGDHAPEVPVHVHCRCKYIPFVDIPEATTRKILADAEEVVQATVLWDENRSRYVITVPPSHAAYPTPRTTKFDNASDLRAYAINQLRDPDSLGIPESAKIGSLKVEF